MRRPPKHVPVEVLCGSKCWTISKFAPPNGATRLLEAVSIAWGQSSGDRENLLPVKDYFYRLRISGLFHPRAKLQIS
jgi:hypothetical protein